MEIIKPYHVYLDDSTQGRYGQKVVAITGYIATVEAWIRFEDEWKGILRRGPFPYFHTTDFLARQPPFNNNWTDEQRNAFMERVTMTASEYPILGIGCCVICDEYERVFPSDMQQGWKDPRYFAFFSLLGLLHELMDEKNTRLKLPQPLHFLIEQQKKFVGNAIELFYAYKKKIDIERRFGDIAPGSREEYLPLQAADLLVYEATRKVVEEENNPAVPLRKPLANLQRKDNVILMELRADLLEQYVKLIREEKLAGE